MQIVPLLLKHDMFCLKYKMCGKRAMLLIDSLWQKVIKESVDSQLGTGTCSVCYCTQHFFYHTDPADLFKLQSNINVTFNEYSHTCILSSSS